MWVNGPNKHRTLTQQTSFRISCETKIKVILRYSMSYVEQVRHFYIENITWLKGYQCFVPEPAAPNTLPNETRVNTDCWITDTFSLTSSKNLQDHRWSKNQRPTCGLVSSFCTFHLLTGNLRESLRRRGQWKDNALQCFDFGLQCPFQPDEVSTPHVL